MPRKQREVAPECPELRGTWFKCENGHLTEDPIFLGDAAYCSKDDCSGKCRIVHSVWDDQEKVEERRRSWNSGINPSIGKLVKQIEEAKEPEPVVEAEPEPVVEEEAEEPTEAEEGEVEEEFGEESESP